MHRFVRKELNMKIVSVLLTLAILLGILPPVTVSVRAADDETITFSTGAVILDSSYSGKTAYIKNGVFSVTVVGATNLTVIFEDVTIDRRAASDRATSKGGLNGSTDIKANVIDSKDAVDGVSQGTTLYAAMQNLGWTTGNNTVKAPVCPFLVTGNSTVTAGFRGKCTFYAGTNNCTVDSSNRYNAPETKGGCGYAGIQVDSGSSLTIDFAEDLTVYGAHQLGTPDEKGYVSVTKNGVTTTALYSDTLRANADISGAGYNDPYDSLYDACTTHVQFSQSGGAGIGGGAAYNTESSDAKSYTQGTPGTIIIKGGKIEAFGGYAAAGIGGSVNGAATTSKISINGGTVIAHGGRFAAGIGDGDSTSSNPSNSFTQATGLIEINGGTVTAYGGVASPGIGCTDDITDTSKGFAANSTSKLQIAVNGGEVNCFSGFPSDFKGTVNANSAAPAAIGAGAVSKMEPNSIYISSNATLSCAGFGNYSLTEVGTNASTVPTINIDSDGYLLLLRTAQYYADKTRELNLYAPQKETHEGIDGEFAIYVSQPADDRYYVHVDQYGVSHVYDKDWKPVDTQKVADLHLTLYVDEHSVLLDTIELSYYFRSIALTLPDPADYGGLYALTVPTEGIVGNTDIPKGKEFITLTVEAHEQGTQSGEIEYPSSSNLNTDAVSDPLTDLDINGTGTTDGLIGENFYPNVYGYTVYFPHDATKLDLYAAFQRENGVSYTVKVDGKDATPSNGSSEINQKIDVTGVDEKVVRISKQDGSAAGLAYKITLIRMGKYDLKLSDPTKVYDGQIVDVDVQGAYTGYLPAGYYVRDVVTGGNANGNLQRPSGQVAEFKSNNVYLGSAGYRPTNYYVNLTMTVTAEAGSSAEIVNYYVKVVAEKGNGNPSINNSDGHMLGFAVTYDPVTGSRTKISLITKDPGQSVLKNATWISNTVATTIASTSWYYNNHTMTLTVADTGTVTLSANGADYVIFDIGDSTVTTSGATGNKSEQKAAAEAAAAQSDTTKTFTYTSGGSFTAQQAFEVRTLSSSETTNEATQTSATAELSGTSTITGYFEVVKEDERIGDLISLPPEDLSGAVLTYYADDGDGGYTELSGPPKDAGTYKVEASIEKESYTAFGSRVFTISKRPVTISQIENWLRYMTTTEYAEAVLPLALTGGTGAIYLENVVSGDELTATVGNAYYNDLSASFQSKKITLEGVTLGGSSVRNYTTESTQYVFGQIAFKTQGVSLFTKTETGEWEKYYGGSDDTPALVTKGNADYHSPADNGLYLSHVEYVQARTVNEGSRAARYAVDIEFGPLQFGFYRGAWDVNELAYVELVDSRWTGMDGTNNRIVLTNYSNRPVWYQMSVELQKLQQDVGGTGRGITPKITGDPGGGNVIPQTDWSEIDPATAGGVGGVGRESSSIRYLHLSGVPQLDSPVYVPVGALNVFLSPTGLNSA